MGYVINLLNFPIIAKKSSFSFVPLPMKLGIRCCCSSSTFCNRNNCSWVDVHNRSSSYSYSSSTGSW
ncbi:MAG: hypothetical protein ACR5K9_10655 [Wolbachia sp.]